MMTRQSTLLFLALITQIKDLKTECKPDEEPVLCTLYLRARLPTNRTAVVGSGVELECKVFERHHPIGYTLNWRRVGPDGVSSALENSGPNTLDEATTVLHLRNVTLDDAGEYICAATNYWGTSQKSFQLTVIEG